MKDGESEPDVQAAYAMGLADESYNWYKIAEIRSRRYYRVSEVALLAFSAAVPATVAIAPDHPVFPAILGSLVVVIAGARTIFHWQENYIRFSRAREAVEAERRSYHTLSPPYDRPHTREQVLAAAITRIEQDEMGDWTKVATERPKA